MYALTKMFEGEFLIEGGSPVFVSGLAFTLSVIFIFHAVLSHAKVSKFLQRISSL